MRSVLRFAALTVLALTPIALCADPLVTATVIGTTHYGEDPFTSSFSFDAVLYQAGPTPDFVSDIYYSVSSDLIGGLFPDRADFSGGGQSLVLFSTGPLGPFTAPEESVTIGLGECQSLPPDPFGGVTPVFVSRRCTGVTGSGGTGFGPEDVSAITEVDFQVSPSAVTPEPPTGLLLSSGPLLVGAMCCRRRSFVR